MGVGQIARPTGISLLCVLHGLGGIGIAVVMVSSIGSGDPLPDIPGISTALFVAGVVFLAVLGIASAIGMWMGRPWGWWLGAFYYAYAIARYANALRMISELSATPGEPPSGLKMYYARYVVRVLVSGLILLYFFKGNVREYFDLEDRSPFADAFFLLSPVVTWLVLHDLAGRFGLAG